MTDAKKKPQAEVPGASRGTASTSNQPNRAPLRSPVYQAFFPPLGRYEDEVRRLVRLVNWPDLGKYRTQGELDAQRLVAAQRVMLASFRPRRRYPKKLDPVDEVAMIARLGQYWRLHPPFFFDVMDAEAMLLDMRALHRRRQERVR